MNFCAPAVTIILALAFVDLGWCSPIFGVSFTDGGGNVVAAANPVQTAALLGTGALAVAGGAALGHHIASSSGRTRTRTVTRYRYGGRRRNYRRGKRATNNDIKMEEAVQITNTALLTMAENDPEDCFRRLLCDIGAEEAGSFHSEAMVNLMMIVSPEFEESLSSQAKDIKQEFGISYMVGEHSKDQAFCEEIYFCPLSGHELDDMMFKQLKKDRIGAVTNDGKEQIKK